ncbi:MAG TPA: hypothetical protein VLG92_03185 [Candidatus Saccharimonadia bacterium]|nr:hypothetical protein [Candidatus Saccharimonadia bacterium]
MLLPAPHQRLHGCPLDRFVRLVEHQLGPEQARECTHPQSCAYYQVDSCEQPVRERVVAGEESVEGAPGRGEGRDQADGEQENCHE